MAPTTVVCVHERVSGYVQIITVMIVLKASNNIKLMAATETAKSEEVGHAS